MTRRAPISGSILSIFLLGGLILGGCSEEDPASPGNGNTVLAEETIGSDGGTVAAAEVLLTVPAGALATERTLSIHASDADHPYGQENEGIYLFEGIPEELGAPITLKIYAGDGARDESVLLFVGEERESQSRGRELAWYEIACRDSAGWCIASLERGPFDLDQDALPTLQVTPVAGLQRISSSRGHFEILFDPLLSTTSQAVSLAVQFEEAHDAVCDLGFHFGDDEEIWPRPVTIMNLYPEREEIGRYITAPHGKGRFAVDYMVFLEEELPGVIAHHEVFHMAQDFYDTRPPAEWETLNMNRVWLDEASSSWIEQKAHPDPAYDPIGLVAGNYLVPIDLGLWGARNMTEQAYGYGMSTLIEYFTSAQGEARILETYEAFADSGNVMSSIQKAADPEPEEWIGDFHRQLVLEQIFDFDDGQVFNLMEVGATLTNDQSLLSPPTYARPFGGAGQKFAIELTEPHSFGALELTADDPFELALFGLKSGQTPTMLGYGVSPLTVGDLRSHLQSYDDFLYIASRPYRTPGDCGFDIEQSELTLQLTEQTDLSRFDTGIIKCEYHATWNDEMVPVQSINFSAQAGAFTGGEFYAPWDYMDGDTRKVGHITITLDPESLDILSWSASSRWVWADDWYNLYEISGTGMTLDDLEENELEYQVDDAATCGVVTHLYVKKMVDGVVTKELLGYECDENSYVRIRIRDEE